MKAILNKLAKFTREIWIRTVILIALVSGVGIYINSAIKRNNSKGGIAFAANTVGNWDLYIAKEDGTSLVQLTETPIDERSPAFSPDGKQIAYSTSDGKLWVMALAAREAKEVVLPPGRYGYPTWLSDGKGIIYTFYTVNPPTEDADFFAYSFDEQKQRPYLIQTGPQDYPASSPAGDQLAYISSLATMIPGFGSTVTQQLWVASLRDGKPQQLLLGTTGDTRPAWSPDGKSLAFSSVRKGSADIWTVNVDRLEMAQLTAGAAEEITPGWSPDGQKIVYIANESGRTQLIVLDIKTKQTNTLSPFGATPVQIKDPCWK